MPETSKENAVAILERAKLEGWVLGKTKVMWLLHEKTEQLIHLCLYYTVTCAQVPKTTSLAAHLDWDTPNLLWTYWQVFLRYYHVEQLNLLLREVIARVVVMQAYTKGWLGARRYRKEKEKRKHGAIIIQSGTDFNSSVNRGKKLFKLKNSDVFFYHLMMKQVRIRYECDRWFLNDLWSIMHRWIFIKEMSLITTAWPMRVKSNASEQTIRLQRVQRDPSLCHLV